MITFILVISLLFSVSCKQNIDSESDVSYIKFNMSNVPSSVTITKYSLKIEPTADNPNPEKSVRVNEVDATYEPGKVLNFSLTPTGKYQLEMSLTCKVDNSTERECYKTKTPYTFNTINVKQVKTDGLVLSSVKASEDEKKTETLPPIKTEDVPVPQPSEEKEQNQQNPPNQTTQFDIVVHATITD